MPTPLFQVDAFSTEAFSGNPAAVALLDAAADASWMVSVAAEMNLAETAFLVRTAPGAYDLRWFTPTAEVDLCGHATLAAAHVLWTEGRDASEVLSFQTRSGALRARRLDDGRIELDFPANVARDTTIAPAVLDALGVTPVRAGATNNGWIVVEVASDEEVRAAAPDFVRLAPLIGHAVAVTAAGRSPSDADIVSRVFLPGIGITEDAVTGSAHCVLAPWWWERVGKSCINAEQASVRGGWMRLVLDGDRVRLQGSAVTTLRGELLA